VFLKQSKIEKRTDTKKEGKNRHKERREGRKAGRKEGRKDGTGPNDDREKNPHPRWINAETQLPLSTTARSTGSRQAHVTLAAEQYITSKAASHDHKR
jgi:hypothetical protein